MSLTYVITPLLAWLVSGAIKFAINSARSRRLAFERIGLGGFPSTHTAIATSTTAQLLLGLGPFDPVFALSMTYSMIVIIDATSLRVQVGRHARAINSMNTPQGGQARLRESIGHTKFQILGGLMVGALVAWVVYSLLNIKIFG